MEKLNLKETAQDLLSHSGKVRGEAFRTHAEYIRFREGEEGVKKVEEKMAELGAPVRFDEIKSFQWLEEGKSSLVIIIAKEVFNWTEDDIFDMGCFAVRVSFFMKVTIKHFLSITGIVKEAPKHWRKHFNIGSLEVVEFSQEKKRILVHIKNFEMHPVVCGFYAGYLYGAMHFAVRSEDIKVKETKCTHKGNSVHEYKITWV